MTTESGGEELLDISRSLLTVTDAPESICSEPTLFLFPVNTGYNGLPAGIMALSLAPGTPPLQLPASLQSVLTLPVQVMSPSVNVICACDPDRDPAAVT